MSRVFAALATGLLLLGHASLAQLPTYQARPADILGAAEGCAQARISDAGRVAYASLNHRQRMARYDVSFYKLDISLENNSRNVAGAVRIKARSLTSGLDSLAFELYPTLVIDSVVVDGRKSPGWRRAAGDVTAALQQPVGNQVFFNALIYYRGTAPNGNSAAIGNALNSAVAPTYGVSTTWSLSEPYNAYEWFPCKQVLTDKADSSEVWVTTSAINKVGSNGLLQAVTPQPNGKVRYEWKSKYPIDYYLISVAVAPYVEYVNYANPVGGPRIPIVNYLYNQAALTTYRTEIDRTPGFIENYSRLVGLYPFAKEKYGHSMAPIGTGSGMEHQTMTTQGGFNFTLTAHELFHQWFGDNVTCGAWEDIWLNEGFASYGEYISLGQFSTAQAARQWMDQAHASVMTIPSGSVFVSDTSDVNRIFSSRLSYKKGAALIHMLRYLLTDDEKFFRALKTYQTTYAGRTARTRDLQRIFEAEAGVSLQYFFDQWFRGQGYPTFAVRWNQVGQTVYLQSTESVSMPTVTPFFNTEVDLRLEFTDGTSRTVRLRQDQPVTGLGLTESRILSNIVIDPDQWILNGAGSVARDNGLVLATKNAVTVTTLHVYPNPCLHQLRITDLKLSRAQAEVVDATGRVVLRQVVTAPAPVLDTRTLAPGIYHLRLTSPDGSVARARFVRASD
ncbi:T9SS type A sorting domain-containing protein [Hymenobacter taeanensis]|uniref:Aminopeptidase N n=1 Tax=Hymenobacter taeanensis TaxID=2735321 RepID=A0A6M6BKG9_9BACT|nr:MULTISPECIES: M1 family aminopeptidase [Hymenobacter]QJX48502.1 T9SS type A sorting domain-containing protein [Hymenobacter taeanensis]UOQ82001.1 T9SS type A sorting domain-containing protein [Hymenobacter sp. 5414T-23]